MINRQPVTAALRTLLQTATGKQVGLVTAPTSGGTTPQHYYVLTPISHTPTGAPMADLSEDATLVYQVTCISGPTPGVPNSRGGVEQAEWLADLARTAILDRHPTTRAWLRPLTVPGARCVGRRVDVEPGATNAPDDATMTYVIRFALDLAND